MPISGIGWEYSKQIGTLRIGAFFFCFKFGTNPLKNNGTIIITKSLPHY